MRSKKIGGVVALALGLILIIISLYGRHRLESAEGKIHKGESFFSGNSYAKSIGGALEGQVNQYRMPLMICLVSGVALAIIGAGILLVSRRKK